MGQQSKQLMAVDHRVGETTALQDGSERHLAFSSLEIYSSPVRNKRNRGGDGIFKLQLPRLESKFIRSQKPFDVLMPALEKS